MSTLSIAKSRNPKSATPKTRSAKPNATSRHKITSAAANAKMPSMADEPKVERVTKQERVLTLRQTCIVNLLPRHQTFVLYRHLPNQPLVDVEIAALP